MTAFYKTIESGYIVGIGTNGPDNVDAITVEEYNGILDAIRNKPSAEDGYCYMLRADTLEWELVELPPTPEPEPTTDEVIDYLFGGDAE